MNTFTTLEDHVILTSTTTTAAAAATAERTLKLSPAEIFKNKYLTQQQQQQQQSYNESKKSDSFPNITTHAPPLNLRTEIDDSEEEEECVLFEPNSPLEPKIVLNKETNKSSSSKILTRISKSTAPMRAKISKSKSTYTI